MSVSNFISLNRLSLFLQNLRDLFATKAEVNDALADTAKVFLIKVEEIGGAPCTSHTFTEVLAAHQAGYMCMVDFYGSRMPLAAYYSGEKFVFSSTEYDCINIITIHSANSGYGYEGVQIEYLSSGNMKMFLTTIYSDSIVAFSDRLFQDIKAAYEDGYFCVANYYGTYMTLSYCDNTEIKFTSGGSTSQDMVDAIIHSDDTVTLRSVLYAPVLDTSGNRTSLQFTTKMSASEYYQNPSEYLIRNIKVSTTEETPTVNGEICWTYG